MIIVLAFLDSEGSSKFQNAYSNFEAAIADFNTEDIGYGEELVLSEYDVETKERGVTRCYVVRDEKLEMSEQFIG